MAVANVDVSELPLSGVRVVDLTRNLSGPYCSMMLGDMGAEVIKVEIPDGGDELRRLYRFPGKAPDSEDYFGMFNRNKRSVALDLKTAYGKEILADLIRISDVFLHNLAPGAVDRLGFDWETVRSTNEKLIYVAISGFGPDDARRAYDGVVQAASGILDLTGYPDAPPALCGVSIGDLSSAMFAAFATVNALMTAAKTGRGTRIDVAMMDSLLALHGGGAALYMATGSDDSRRGCEAPHRAPGNIYKTSDSRYVFLVTNNATWSLLCTALSMDDLENDERFATNQDRVRNRIQLNSLIGDRIGRMNIEEVCNILTAHNVPNSRVATLPEVFQSQYVRDHQMLIEISGDLRDGREPIEVMGMPYKMGNTKLAVRLGPPRLGEANSYVIEELLGRKKAPAEGGEQPSGAN